MTSPLMSDELVLLDSRAAERCPVALDAEVVGVVPEPPSEVVSKWRDAARAHRTAVLEQLAKCDLDLVHLTGDLEQRIRETEQAIERRTVLILGPRFASDLRARRRGQADALILSDDGYLPILIKRHRVALATAAGRSLSSSLARPLHSDAVVVHGRKLGKVARRDASELAHLVRLGQGLGFDLAPTGGIVDDRGAIWWVDLSAPRPGGRSFLERYDEGFAFAERVVARAVERRADDQLPPLVIPLHKAECARCGFEPHCRASMEAADSVSLIPGMQWRHALDHIRHGRGTRQLLAELDPATAQVVEVATAEDPTLDLPSLVDLARTVDGETPVAHLVGEHMATRRALRKAGISTAAELVSLDATTLAYGGRGGVGVRVAIERARAARAGHPFLKSGRTSPEVPRADLEIDVDMEHAEGATYLWGAVVTANANLPGDLRALDGTYRAFVDFDGLDVDREVHLVVALLDWIDELRAVAEANSATWLVAFYSHAEIDELRRIATMSGDTGLISRVERVAKSPNWVDMRVVVEDNLIVGHGVGLKKLAPYAGFSWRDDDPSGSASLTWYDKAVGADDAAERGQYQARLLAYNEDDCRATVALRVWMSTAAFTSIDDWEGPTLGS